MNGIETESSLVYRPKGVIEDRTGLVIGFWVRGRKGRREAYFFEKPIKRGPPYHVECKSIFVDGQLVHDVPVEVYPEVNSLLHWGKYARK